MSMPMKLQSTWFKCKNPECNEDVRAMKKTKLCVSCQQKADYRKRHKKEKDGTI